MKIKKRYVFGAAILAVLASILLSFSSLLKLYWQRRSDNPVRKGTRLAGELGCFSCHGFEGGNPIPDPGSEELEVPRWSGGVWMMYVENDEEIREFILDGISRKRAKSKSAQKELAVAEVRMPAYRGIVSDEELGSLVAAFKVLSGMSIPSPGSPERSGYNIARSFKCFSCHGAGGAGGLPNPGSLSGFIPGWYGHDFRDLVRDRSEFDEWIKEGKIERLSRSPLARFFLSRQRVKMPAYKNVSKPDLDALWAYVQWLDATSGGVYPPRQTASREEK